MNPENFGERLLLDYIETIVNKSLDHIREEYLLEVVSDRIKLDFLTQVLNFTEQEMDVIKIRIGEK